MPKLTPWLRKTLIAMWLATLSLAGIPPFIGFWSKEGIVGLLVEKGLVAASMLAIVTIPITAFYSTRMLLFNTAYNKGEKKLEEPPLYVLATYGLLGVLALVIGLAWPVTSESFYSTVLRTLALGGEAEKLVHIGVTAIAGLLLALGGVGISAAAYYARMLDTRKIALSVKPLTDFLYDRWLFNPILYKVFVRGGDYVASVVYSVVERSLDNLLHVKLTGSTRVLSIVLRRMQTGDIGSYVAYLIAGMVLVIVIYVLGAL